MKKRIIMLMMAAVLTFSMCACGSNSGGLGKLEINQKNDDDDDDDKKDKKDKKDETDDVPDIGSEDDVPDVGGGTSDEPQDEPQSDKNQLVVELFQGEAISMYIPKGWKTYENIFNSGTGVYRVMFGAYDPEKPDNRIIYATAFEPFFANQTEYNKMAKYLDIDPPVLSSLDAEGVIGAWNQTYNNMKLQQFSMCADIFGTMQIDSIVESNILDGSTDSIIASNVVAKVTGMDGDKYDLYYQCALAPTYYAHLGATYYICYQNSGVFYEADNDQDYQFINGLINGCLASVDATGLNNKNGIDANSDNIYIKTPEAKFGAK